MIQQATQHLRSTGSTHSNMSGSDEQALITGEGAVPRPSFDPALIQAVRGTEKAMPADIDVEGLRKVMVHQGPEWIISSFPDLNLEHTEISVPLSGGEASILMSIFKPKEHKATNMPAMYYVHPGGQVAGHRISALADFMKYFDGIETVFASVEYRLAPEAQAPAAAHDSHAGLVWLAEHASEFSIDASKIFVISCSGGAPAAFGSVLMCRDEGKRYPYAVMLSGPVLDDRSDTVSSKQFERSGPLCGATGQMAWGKVLGDRKGGPDVDGTMAPARAEDLTGMPPFYLDAGACEAFRDETVALASKLWKCGVNADLHIWSGAYHGFQLMSKNASLTKTAVANKAAWIQRMLAN